MTAVLEDGTIDPAKKRDGTWIISMKHIGAVELGRGDWTRWRGMVDGAAGIFVDLQTSARPGNPKKMYNQAPMDAAQTSLSKFLSLVLRHQPERIGIELDAAGWIEVEQLLAACAAAGRNATRQELEQVVRESDKQRFAFSADGKKIRANQGHSVAVQLDHEPCVPPAVLYHGTVDRFLASIRSQGLLKRARHHVHLSASRHEAERVGARRGRPVVLEVRAEVMAAQGFVFFRSPNGVWLTDHVPPAFLIFP